MEERADIFYQFFQELIESYRHDILQREDAKELAEKESKRLLDRKLSKFIKMSVLSKTGIFLLKFL